MDDSIIIDRCGGTTVVARLCEITPSAVTQWRANGIPRARLLYLRAIRPDVFAPTVCDPAPAPPPMACAPEQ